MTPKLKHFYSLDNLRGVAALLVVVYHWDIFFYGAPDPFHPDPQLLPLHTILKPIYEQGLMAVDLFFSLSGFIFFWLYARKIEEHQISFGKFAALRFSRLYPLHFVTLLLVAALTWCFRLAGNNPFESLLCNDWHHFVLQIFFISNWGWEKGLSFNGPIWSVSVEVWLYLMFFSLCRLRWTDWRLLIGYSLAGWWLMESHAWLVGKGILCFFLGGLAYKTYTSLLALDRLPRVKTIVWLLAGVWVVIPVNFSLGLAFRVWWHLSDSATTDFAGWLLVMLTTYSYDFFLFPATLVLLALWETRRGTLGRRLSFLGDISYASYLWHFPLQMLIVIIAVHWHWSQAVFRNPASLLVFILLVIGVSLASHRWFEKPLQDWLRKKLAPAR